MSTKKGAKRYYDILITDEWKPTCCKKWDTKLDTENDWKTIFWKTSKISDINLKWFQTKILHRCLGNNVLLKQMKIIDSDQCIFCQDGTDTIEHMFWECNEIHAFWNQLMDILNRKCINTVNVNVTKSLVLLGHDPNIHLDNVSYFILIFAKKYIYQCKLKEVKPILKVFLSKLKYRHKIEKYNARMKFSQNKFDIDWMPYQPLISD